MRFSAGNSGAKAHFKIESFCAGLKSSSPLLKQGAPTKKQDAPSSGSNQKRATTERRRKPQPIRKHKAQTFTPECHPKLSLVSPNRMGYAAKKGKTIH